MRCSPCLKSSLLCMKPAGSILGQRKCQTIHHNSKPNCLYALTTKVYIEPERCSPWNYAGSDDKGLFTCEPKRTQHSWLMDLIKRHPLPSRNIVVMWIPRRILRPSYSWYLMAGARPILLFFLVSTIKRLGALMKQSTKRFDGMTRVYNWWKTN